MKNMPYKRFGKIVHSKDKYYVLSYAQDHSLSAVFL